MLHTRGQVGDLFVYQLLVFMIGDLINHLFRIIVLKALGESHWGPDGVESLPHVVDLFGIQAP